MKHGSLFSGQGGFDLAAQWMGWENVFHCEIDPICRSLLNHYWPNSESYADIKKTDFTKWRGTIDILSGGFPCQGFSLAGKRLGTEDDRYLWPEMRRCYNESRPSWIVGENVTGILSMEDKSGFQREIFAQVEDRKIIRYREIDHYEAIYTRQADMLVNNICEDLEEDGYEVQTFTLPAAAKQAPHQRDRVFFIAYSNSDGHQLRRPGKGRFEEEKSKRQGNKRERIWDDDRRNGEQRDVTDTGSQQLEEWASIGNGKDKKEEGTRVDNWIERSGNIGDVTNPNGIRQRGQSDGEGITRFIGKEMPYSNWDHFPTQSPVCTGDDGVSPGMVRAYVESNSRGLLTEKEIDTIVQRTLGRLRKESIKSGGNAVVPQVVLEIFRTIHEYENQELS